MTWRRSAVSWGFGSSARLQVLPEPHLQAPQSHATSSADAERDTKLPEVLIGQVAKNRDVNVAFGKALRVLGHAELFEPLRNLLHRGPVAYASGWAVRGVYPTRHEIEGHFPAGLTFLPRLLATADKVIE